MARATKERQLLTILIEAPCPMTIDELAYRMYGTADEADLLAVHSLLSRLRRKYKIKRYSAYQIIGEVTDG